MTSHHHGSFTLNRCVYGYVFLFVLDDRTLHWLDLGNPKHSDDIMEILPVLHSAWNFSSSNLLFPDVNVLSSLPFDNVPVESNILRGLEHFTVLQHNQYVLLAAEAKKKKRVLWPHQNWWPAKTQQCNRGSLWTSVSYSANDNDLIIWQEHQINRVHTQVIGPLCTNEESG